jgi:hypothetical protein
MNSLVSQSSKGKRIFLISLILHCIFKLSPEIKYNLRKQGEDYAFAMKYLDMSLIGQEQGHLNLIKKRVHEIAQHEETQVSGMIRRSQKENSRSTLFIAKASITSFDKGCKKCWMRRTQP